MSNLSKFVKAVLNNMNTSKEEKNTLIMSYVAGKFDDADMVELIDWMNRVYFDDAYVY